ncbi:MAG: hypothetical protein AB1589_29885 [Cyanobacteriota bacterium]
MIVSVAVPRATSTMMSIVRKSSQENGLHHHDNFIVIPLAAGFQLKNATTASPIFSTTT